MQKTGPGLPTFGKVHQSSHEFSKMDTTDNWTFRAQNIMGIRQNLTNLTICKIRRIVKHDKSERTCSTKHLQPEQNAPPPSKTGPRRNLTKTWDYQIHGARSATPKTVIRPRSGVSQNASCYADYQFSASFWPPSNCSMGTPTRPGAYLRHGSTST